LQDDFDEYDDKDEETYYIPQEVVMAFKCHREQVQRKREELRAKLRANFERLCVQHGVQTQVQKSKRTTSALVGQ